MIEPATEFGNLNGSPFVKEVRPLSDDERATLMDVAALLQEKGLTDRVGISLLHKHFDLAADEVMVEEESQGSRVLTSAPAKVESLLGRSYLETNWRIEDGKLIPIGACATGMYGQHYGYKND